jgi:hypothetical protein
LLIDDCTLARAAGFLQKAATGFDVIELATLRFNASRLACRYNQPAPIRDITGTLTALPAVNTTLLFTSTWRDDNGNPKGEDFIT